MSELPSPHILVFWMGTTGDFLPFLGISHALQQRGRRVTMFGNGYFRAQAEQLGIPFVDLITPAQYLDRLRERANAQDLESLKVNSKYVVEDLRPVYQALIDHYVPGQTVVIAQSYLLGTRIAQEHLGFPLATVHLHPMLVRSSLASPWWIPRWLVRLGYRIVDILIDAALASPINELRAELGQAPVTRIMDRWWNSSDLVLACFPDWLSPARADWPAKCQQVGFPDFNPQHGQALSAEVESFLDSGDAPIIFAHSAAVKQLDGFVDHSIAAARTMGYRSIFLGVDPPDHHEADVCFRPAEPHHLLLPRSAALVHHGGLGTALAAIRAGIPQLCVPQMLDQPANARSITQLGMGNTLSWKRYRASDLVRKLKPLLVEPRYREATRRYQQLLRSAPNACEQAADAIEAIFPTAEGSTGSRPS